MDQEEYRAAIAALRRQKDTWFAEDDDSPIPLGERSTGFTGLRYFDVAPSYRVSARLHPLARPEQITLGSTKGDPRQQIHFADLRFTIDGQTCQLAAFKDATEESSAVFVPFRDATSGHESYGAGRYLEFEDTADPSVPHDVVLDFNLAYNPWCAYNSAYSCTLPPVQNRLAVAIRAGEMTYSDDH